MEKKFFFSCYSVEFGRTVFFFINFSDFNGTQFQTVERKPQQQTNNEREIHEKFDRNRYVGGLKSDFRQP